MSAGNTFGSFFRLHSFGESHGPALGAVIDGIPAGVEVNEDFLRQRLARRRPGQSALVSARNEGDIPEILSGVYQGRSLGTPIAVIVRNADARSQDYEAIALNPRPGHADDVWKMKYEHSDPRGGGRSSGRETLSRVIGGALAELFVKSVSKEIDVVAFAEQIGPFTLSPEEILSAQRSATDAIDQAVARFPSAPQSAMIEELLTGAKSEGKSYGGRAQVFIKNPPGSLGRPVFHKLKADFAAAMMSVGATSSFELGDGFGATHGEGSEFHKQGEKPYGGIRGGISTGESIIMSVGFKPTSSVLDVAKKGRHDPCIVPRAIPVLEAMTWLVLADHVLARRLDRV